MTCESCQQREACVHIQEVVENKAKVLHLCSECAAANGLLPENAEGIDLNAVIYNLTSQALAHGKTGEGAVDADAPQQSCSGCGTTTADYRQTGRLGCPTCYATFAELLEPMMAATHRGERHQGKTPGRTPGPERTQPPGTTSVTDLEQDLARAVASEAYERAAELRDRIRAVARATSEK